MEQSYAGYDAWKGWGADQFMVLSDAERTYYSLEFRGIPVHGERVLEIGFGSGVLLAWLKEQGAEVFGTELSRQGAALARERNITVLEPDLLDVGGLEGSFSTVAAFDVLEHLDNREIADLIDRIAVLLRPGGRFIVRFPNGGSPFGRSIQHGDVTHVSTLTISKVGQMLAGKPFIVDRAGDAAVALHGNLVIRLAKHGRNWLRSAFESGLRALYGIQGPLHPNLTMVLRRE